MNLRKRFASKSEPFEDRSFDPPPCALDLPGVTFDGSIVHRSLPSLVSIYDEMVPPPDDPLITPPFVTVMRSPLSDLTIMSDSPQERLMMAAGAREMSGSVLIGGLGLGMVLQYLPTTVTHVMVIERNGSVLDHVFPHARRLLEARNIKCLPLLANAWAAVRDLSASSIRFDSAYFDIWDAPNDPDDLPEKDAIMEACRSFVSGRVVCWGHAWSFERAQTRACGSASPVFKARKLARMKNLKRSV